MYGAMCQGFGRENALSSLPANATMPAMKPLAKEGRWLWVAACAAVVLLYLGHLSAYFDFTADDPGITFRYGANLFDGRGLVYNPGEHIEGYSNFGHVVLSGLIYKCLSLFGDARWGVLFAVKLLNVGFGLATGYFIYRYAVDIAGRGRVAGLAPVLLAAANGALLINIASPLETAAYIMLLTAMMWGLACYVTGPPERSARRAVMLAPLGSAILLWRIDSPMLFAAFVAALVLLRRGRLQRSDWWLLGIWAVVFGAYTVFRFAWFGDLLNNPFYTKVRHRMGLAAPFGSPYVAGFFRLLGLHALVFVALATIVVRRSPGVYILPLALVVTQWLYILLVDGDWMAGYRFWAVVVPALCLVLTGLLDLPVPWIAARPWRLIKVGVVLVVAAVWCSRGLELYRAVPQEPFRFVRRLGGFSPRNLYPYTATAEWLNRHVSKDATMAVEEAGYMPFLTGLAAIDTYGLCNRTLARVDGHRNRLGLKVTWDPAEPGVRYILSQKPDIIVVGPVIDWANAPDRFLGVYRLAASPQAGLNVFRREDSTRVH